MEVHVCEHKQDCYLEEPIASRNSRFLNEIILSSAIISGMCRFRAVTWQPADSFDIPILASFHF